MTRFATFRSRDDQPLTEVAAALHGRLPDEELARLERRGVRTLADLAAWSFRDGRAPQVDAEVRTELDAQAAFAAMPTTPAANARLYAAGFTRPSDITTLSRDEFIARLGRRISRASAIAIHDAATVQERVLANVGAAASTSGSAATIQRLGQVLGSSCSCAGCRSGVSPAAYLADLLDFAVRHLRTVVPGRGLRGEYYVGSFAAKRLERIDSMVDFDWGTGSPDSELPADGFSVRWSGSLRPRYSEAYTFTIRADASVQRARLWIDGTLVVSPSSWSSGGGNERSGQIVLHADQPYGIRLEYENASGPAQVRLLWSSFSQGREIVPAARLSAPRRTEPLGLDAIETRLGQPLSGLLEDCRYVERPVHRARIACEALRSILPPPYASYTDPGYTFAIYDFLLGQLGTSYGELRRVVAAADRRERRQLAIRLGITGRGLPDHLDELLLDPSDASFDEERLEALFGYASTTRSPLAPDQPGQVLGWRQTALHRRWVDEDRPANPPAGTRPIIDADLVAAPDLVDAAPTLTWPRTPTRPMDFLEDRERWLQQRLAEVQLALDDPNVGLESLITDRFVDQNGQMRPLMLGLGIEVADFETLVARLRAGDDVTADLAALRLDAEALEYLGWAWATSRLPGVLTDADWEPVAAIFVETGKRAQFATWRAEEAARNIVLSPQIFRIRPPPRPGFEFPWMPRRFRSTLELRRAWERTLRRRIAQERELDEEWRTAVGAAEERFRVLQRDRVWMLYRDTTPAPVASIERLTYRFQLDLRARACQTTTRVAQAIESVQGLLFGSRNGLLDADVLALDDPAGFDAAWQWLGAYSSWRAALRVFLYPENALKPTLRRDASGAFRAIVERLRATGPPDPDRAVEEAEAYEPFFRDVCSLEFEALGRVSPSEAPATSEPWHLIVARGAHTGSLYACLQDLRPDSWLQAGFRRGSWDRIPDLESGVEVIAVVDYRTPVGRSAAGLYVRGGPPERRRMLFTRHDGTGWSPPREAGTDTLVTAALHDAEVPPSPARAAAAGAGWGLSATESAAALDVDGDGRAELLLVAPPDDAGARAVGLLRALGGGLTLDGRTTLAAGWRLPTGAAVVLRTTLVRSPDDRREQLLVIGEQGGQPAIGLLGAAGRDPALVASAVGAVAGAGTTWPIVVNAAFTAADVDGDGYSELIAVEALNATSHRVSVLRVRESGFTLLSSQVVTATDLGQAVNERWLGIVPIADQPAAQTLLVHRDWVDYQQARVTGFRWNATAGQLQESGPADANLLWLPGSPQPIGFESGSGLSLGPYVWPLARVDRLQRARLGLSGSSDLLMFTSPERPDTAVARADLRMVWRSARTIPAGATVRDWDRRVDDLLVAADLDGDSAQELVLVAAQGGALAVAGRTPERGLALRWAAGASVRPPGGSSEGSWPIAGEARFLVGDLDGDGCEEIVALQAGTAAVLRGLAPKRSAFELDVRDTYGPRGVSEFAVTQPTSPRWTSEREARVRAAYLANQSPDPGWTDPDLAYLDEAYYFLPIEFALRLQEARYWNAALDWVRGVYDYGRPADQRKRAFMLVLNGEEELGFARTLDWLRDPLNPHLVARTRRDSYTRFTIIAVARCLIGAADEEFTRATAESLPRARELYLRALDLLESPELAESATACADNIGTLDIQIGDDELRWVWLQVPERLGRLRSPDVVATAVRDIQAILASRATLRDRVARSVARVRLAERADRRAAPRDRVLERDAASRLRLERALLVAPGVEPVARRVGREIVDARDGRAANRVWALAPDGLPTLESLAVAGRWELVPAVRASFCVPPNPVVGALRRHIELSLEKLRDCRNIAGLRMRVEPYEPETAATSADGLPTPRRGFQPLPYRYATLVERAERLVDLARQIEQSMLSAIEAGERARYEELRARQDLALARGGVRLRELQLVQADDGVRAAELQRDRAASAAEHYRDLMAEGTTTNEDLSLGFLYGAATLQTASAAASFVSAYQVSGVVTGGTAQAVASGLSSLAAAATTTSQIFSTIAAFERREQEWRFQETLSRRDIAIGEQQIRLAEDESAIASQERDVAVLQVDHAEEILDFLVLRRFATAELYEWMSALLEQIYRFFLQQATAMAQLAEGQLSFERQEVPPPFIRADYWQVPSTDAFGRAEEDRRGLTGSARLLRDLTELDQYAFRTERRKLQLSKTISLAELDPVAFQRFRSTGVLPFRTAMDLFDQDFPGHHLRLVKRVRTSVIALIPPVQGIHATLSTTGPSRTVVGGDAFETVVVQRPPETVALTSPYEATGVFELNAAPELLAPFEGMGIDADWEFRLPRPANQFPFEYVADVLVTLDYTALDSADYRAEVLRRLDRERVAERAFLFRNEFADAWYDLNNPDLVEAPAQPMVVSFSTARADYPANLEGLEIRNVALVFTRREGTSFEVQVADLAYDDGAAQVATGVITTVDGILSSRRASGAPLAAMQRMYPAGRWTLSFAHENPALDAQLRRRFADRDIEDLMLVVTYAGETPAWPE
jgi:hypothetical protein